MKKHPFANQLRLGYWYLYREIQIKSELLKIKQAISIYLQVLETRDLADRLCKHGGLYSVNRQTLVNPELLSALQWELYSIDSDIQNANRRISTQRQNINNLTFHLG